MPYKPVDVDIARQVSQHYEKEVVVIVSIDTLHNRIRITTYGATPFGKLFAAHLGELCNQAVGSGDPLTMYEDFRAVPAEVNAAEAAEARDLLSLVRRLDPKLPAELGARIDAYISRHGAATRPKDSDH